MVDNELHFLRIPFTFSTTWNLIGAGFGCFSIDHAFQRCFGNGLSDPLVHALFKGLLDATLLYFSDHVIVACNLLEHTGIVIAGATGKVASVLTLPGCCLRGLATTAVFNVGFGVIVFLLLFVDYVYRFQTIHSILQEMRGL